MYDAVVALRDHLTRLAGGPDHYDRIGRQIREAKAEVVGKYGEIFSPQHIPTLTQDEFRSFLLFKNNRHWDNLQRQGPQMTADMPALRRALTILVDESRPVRQRLDQLRPHGGEPMVKFLGRAVITAILLVRQPERYGIVNNIAEIGMERLGVWPSFPPRASLGGKHDLINTVLLKLAGEIPTDLWTLDMLWWRVQPHVPSGSGISAPPSGDPGTDIEASGVGTPLEVSAPSDAALAIEAHLQEFLVENRAQTDLGIEWDLIEEEGEIVGSYYETHEVGQIDLLARHKKGNQWLVVELKRGQTSDATVGQLLRYRSWLRENIARPGDIVEEIVICSNAELKLKYAVKGLEHVRCMTFKVKLRSGPGRATSAKRPLVRHADGGTSPERNRRGRPARPPDPEGTPARLPYYKNAIVFTPDISNRFRHRRFLHATLSSSSTI
ncbi:MAG: endonuclease NucS domain-containing protein [Bryobacteraceae bacterium]